MQLALLQGFEMGTHEIPFHPDSPLCWIFWLVFLLGAGIQFLSLRPKRKKPIRWGLTMVLVCGLLACEIACQVIIGWDLILLMIVYFYLLAMLLGAGVCALAVALVRKYL